MDISPLRGLLKSNLVLAVAAIAAGLLAAWLGARHLDQRAAGLEHQARQRYVTAPYIVASRDVPRGQKLDASLLSVRSMPSVFAPTDALGPNDAGLLIGGRLAVSIRRGTPVVQAALLPQSTRERLSEQLPDGMRAITIQVDQLNALSGHLEAGDAVDVFYSHTRGNGAVLVPLLQRVLVLATGEVTQGQVQSQPEEQQIDFSSVTLLLSATDAQRIVLAEQTGRLSLLLRRASDKGILDPVSVSSSDLVMPPRMGRLPADPFSRSVELLVGGNGNEPVRSWLRTGEGA